MRIDLRGLPPGVPPACSTACTTSGLRRSPECQHGNAHGAAGQTRGLPESGRDGPPLHGAAPCLLRAPLRGGEHGAAPCGCRGAAPWGRAGLLRGGVPRRSVVALWSLRDRSVVAPWSLRGCSVIAPALFHALRMRDSQRATGRHSVPSPAFATVCTQHALPWPWPWALPVGTAAADTANFTVAAVCARSKALSVLAVNLHASRFANSVCNAETLSEMLIADTLCTANSVGTALHRKQCLQSTIQFFSFANTLCKHSQQTLTVLSRHFGKRSYKSTSQTLQSCTDLQAL